MKTIFTRFLKSVSLPAILLFVLPFASKSQNIFQNSGFDKDGSYWDSKDMKVDINPETVFGGKDEGNNIAEIDYETGLRQLVKLEAGIEYQITYKASRNTNKGTPDEVSFLIYIRGAQTGNGYFKSVSTYSNTEFALKEGSTTFQIPADIKDDEFYIEFLGYNTKETTGVLIDDVELSPLNALPVLLQSFSAELSANKTILRWKTSNEFNNNYFSIERSANGTLFEPIGTVSADISNNAMHLYSFTDAKPNNGINYYRLHQVNADGTGTYSKLVIIKWVSESNTITVFPTIATTTINISIPAQTNTSVMVTVVDATGKQLIRSSKTLQTGANQQSVDVSSLPKGLYYMIIKNTNGSLYHTTAFQKAQ